MTVDIWAQLENPLGDPIKTYMNFGDPSDGGGASLDYILNVGKPSSLLLTVPIQEEPNFEIDSRILPMISINGRAPYNDNQACYFVRKKTITRDWCRISAHHANTITERRVVAYDSNTSYTLKTGFATDVIKEFTRDNLGVGVVAADRDGDDTGANVSAYLILDADDNLGASITRSTDRGTLFGVLDDIAQDSTQAGTYVAWNIVYGEDKLFYFRSRANQWGLDRTFAAGGIDAVILSPFSGNITNWYLEIDHTEAYNVAYAGGRGQNNTRIIQQAIDLDKVNALPFGRIEKYVDAPGAQTTAAVSAAASTALRLGDPKITIQADIVPTSLTRGLQFDLGDLVTARIPTGSGIYDFDCRLDTIYVSVRKGNISHRIQAVGPP